MTTFASVEALQAVLPSLAAGAAGSFLPSGGAAAQAGTPGTGGFGQLVNQGLSQVNQQLLASQTALQHLALGDAQNLHQIMINMEETRMSFQLMMQVRSRLLEAYQDLMKMQI